MALIMSIEMDQTGIIEAIRTEASKSVATPEGKVMVVEIVAVRKPVPGYAANITFEDIDTAGAKLTSIKETPVKATRKTTAKKTVAQQATESQKKMGTTEQVEQSPMDAASSPDLDLGDEEEGDPDDVVVDDLDIATTDDEEETEEPATTAAPFDAGVQDEDDVFS